MADVPTVATVTAASLPSAHHAVNEDAILLGPLAPATGQVGPVQVTYRLEPPLVLAVADGLGGHPAGDLASQMVTSQLARRAGALVSEEAIEGAVREINTGVYQAMAARLELAGMGSTLAGLAVHDGWVAWFNVGDSPVFVWDPPYLAQLSPADVPQGEARGRVTQTLGGLNTFCEIDPHVGTEKFRAPARYLVCSDGLAGVLDVADIEAVMGRPAMETVDALLAEVADRGSPDDCSLIILDLSSPEAEPVRKRPW